MTDAPRLPDSTVPGAWYGTYDGLWIFLPESGITAQGVEEAIEFLRLAQEVCEGSEQMGG